MDEVQLPLKDIAFVLEGEIYQAVSDGCLDPVASSSLKIFLSFSCEHMIASLLVKVTIMCAVTGTEIFF